MKRWITALLLVLLLSGTANADTMQAYALSPGVVDTQALLALTFGAQVANATRSEREYPFYELPNTDGAPFCGLDDTVGFGQLRITGFTELVATQIHEPDIWENIEPSGVARGTLTAPQAQVQAEAALQSLGITDYQLQSITAYGRLTGVDSGYRVAFGQLLNGLPVYWAAALHQDDMDIRPESNRVEVSLCDSGLVMVSGYWSQFTPTGAGQAILSEEQAVASFAAMGEPAPGAERCYLLTGSQTQAQALPAYRYQNRFLSAADGTLLQ